MSDPASLGHVVAQVAKCIGLNFQSSNTQDFLAATAQRVSRLGHDHDHHKLAEILLISGANRWREFGVHAKRCVCTGRQQFHVLGW